MSKKTLMDAFEVKTTGIKIDNIEDYDVFKDKDLFDKNFIKHIMLIRKCLTRILLYFNYFHK